MSRLINADAIPYVTDETYLHEFDYAYRYAIDALPTVDAVPIEYIQHWIDKQNYGRRNGKMMLAKALNELIAEWRTEHETCGR